MTTPTQVLGRANLSHTGFEPMVIDGDRHGSVHFIRDDRRNGRLNRAALWTLTADELPYRSPYVFANEETFLVLEGELEMTFENGSAIVLTKGDIISIAAGTKTDWRIETPFKKFVVETGA